MNRLSWLVSASLLCAFASKAQSQVFVGQIDTFQDGTLMDWAGGDVLTNISTGGPGGAGDRYLQMVSRGGIGPGSRLGATNEAQWTGNYLTAGVNRIDVDLRNESAQDLFIRIVLYNTDAVRWTSTNAFLLASGSGWTHLQYSIAEADLTEVMGAMSYAETFSAITQLQFRHQTGAPNPQGTVIAAQMGMDNVEAVPEPATLLVLLTGGFSLIRRKRK